MLRKVLIGVLLAALAAASPSAAVPSASRYVTSVLSTSPVAAHPPLSNGNFWLGDYVFLSIRDRSLGAGLYKKYRVCWQYAYFGRRACHNGYLSRAWPTTPPRFRVGYNDNIHVEWFVGSRRVATRRLHIVSE
jgi:hypothetical protein